MLYEYGWLQSVPVVKIKIKHLREGVDGVTNQSENSVNFVNIVNLIPVPLAQNVHLAVIQVPLIPISPPHQASSINCSHTI